MSNAHDSEVSSGPLARLVRAALRHWYTSAGWTIVGDVQMPRKAVLVAAPHSSNWDFPYALAVGAHYRLRLNFVGKDSLFRWPFGCVMRWLGGIPVDRKQRNDTVATLASAFAAREDMHLVVAPEGTRDAVSTWKSGFYHIATAANVPLALAYLDYAKKQGGIGEIFYPTGNYETDMMHIRDFYCGFTPKNPRKTISPSP
jgi:1-acyl-sn-glycerol-3-phosphate acyltransferase